MPQAKKKLTDLSGNSFLEQIRGLPNSASKKSQKDILKNSPQAAWNQFWGSESESFEKASPPEAVERKEIQRKAAYETRQETILFSAKEQRVVQEIEVIRQELLNIIKTIKEVDFEVEKAVIEIPAKPGIYHVRFLERIRKVLKLIREKLEDSQTWLKLSVGKRKQRGYWSMYKKKGTSFGLSGERTISTQTG